jgi:hypothetical protein
MQSARNSARMLEEASLTGEAILSAMSGSRERLKVSAIQPLHSHMRSPYALTHTHAHV